jgi:hypothetical protein
MIEYIVNLIKQSGEKSKDNIKNVVKFSKPSGYKNINHFTIPPKY